MSDIVERLEDMQERLVLSSDDDIIIFEAVSEIKKLRAALKPFAEQVGRPVNIYEHEGVRMAFVDQDVLDRLCRAAAAALKGTSDERRNRQATSDISRTPSS